MRGSTAAALYARNGLQVMPFNTLYQFEAARRHAGLRASRGMSCPCLTCSAIG